MLTHATRLSLVSGLILTAGFLLFAYCVSQPPASTSNSADGIVVLTGGEDRIAEAVKLLANGKAKRLLISGVNPSTNKLHLISFNSVRGRERLFFSCCIDLDKRALNTEENATEATAWVREKGFHSLIVVTSTYHMPRSLVELRQAMPDVKLIPYPVKSPTLDDAWWTSQRAIWVLAKEYGKFVTALARYAAHSLIGETDDEPAARIANARLR